MQVPVISEVGHVAVRVRDLRAAEEFATALVGLHVTARTDNSIWLSHSNLHHGLQYIHADEDAIDHVGLVAADADALADIRRRIDDAGLPMASEVPLGPGPLDGFAFEATDGFVFEIYSAMERVDHVDTDARVRPKRFGHVNFAVTDPAEMLRMLTEVLDFRVSDYVGDGAFMRCNVDHHGIGVIAGEGLLHHYAWEYRSLIELGLIGDTVDSRGGSTLWGPARHGIGKNHAMYLEEPSGLVAEFYSDMDRIYDEAHYVPGTWTLDGHKWMSRWAAYVPQEMFALGLPSARRAVA